MWRKSGSREIHVRGQKVGEDCQAYVWLLAILPPRRIHGSRSNFSITKIANAVHLLAVSPK
jgi:hypothetical protein